jgi:hypothetical protein
LRQPLIRDGKVPSQVCRRDFLLLAFLFGVDILNSRFCFALLCRLTTRGRSFESLNVIDWTSLGFGVFGGLLGFLLLFGSILPLRIHGILDIILLCLFGNLLLLFLLLL